MQVHWHHLGRLSQQQTTRTPLGDEGTYVCHRLTTVQACSMEIAKTQRKDFLALPPREVGSRVSRKSSVRQAVCHSEYRGMNPLNTRCNNLQPFTCAGNM
jgi:hypothetical protein